MPALYGQGQRCFTKKVFLLKFYSTFNQTLNNLWPLVPDTRVVVQNASNSVERIFTCPVDGIHRGTFNLTHDSWEVTIPGCTIQERVTRTFVAVSVHSLTLLLGAKLQLQWNVCWIRHEGTVVAFTNTLASLAHGNTYILDDREKFIENPRPTACFTAPGARDRCQQPMVQAPGLS